MQSLVKLKPKAPNQHSHRKKDPETIFEAPVFIRAVAEELEEFFIGTSCEGLVRLSADSIAAGVLMCLSPDKPAVSQPAPRLESQGSRARHGSFPLPRLDQARATPSPAIFPLGAAIQAQQPFRPHTGAVISGRSGAALSELPSKRPRYDGRVISDAPCGSQYPLNGLEKQEIRFR
jgi:hypothetical protein